MTLVLYFSPVTLVDFCLALVRFGTSALIIRYSCKGRSGASAMKIRQHVIRWGLHIRRLGIAHTGLAVKRVYISSHFA